MNLKRIPETQGWLQRIGEEVIRWHTFMPRMIDMEASRICNLSCPACMRGADSSLAQVHKNDTHFLTLEQFRKIHQCIPTIGTLNFMSDGEPLMDPELRDLIHYASLNDIHTVLTTNATLITKEFIDFCKENNVYRMHASVDAAHKELYESIRIGADFQKTLENVKLMGQSGITLCINVVLVQQNIQEMSNMVRLAKDVGASEITFLMPICTLGDDRPVKPQDSPQNRQRFLDAAHTCNELGIKWVFPLTLNPTFRRFSFPFIRPQISIEGDIYACCYSLGRGRVWFEGYDYELPSYNMGNMFKDGFKKVWYGEGFQEIRRIYKESEERRGTVVSREEFLKRTIQEMEHGKDKYSHCRICLARWGHACS